MALEIAPSNPGRNRAGIDSEGLSILPLHDKSCQPTKLRWRLIQYLKAQRFVAKQRHIVRKSQSKH